MVELHGFEVKVLSVDSSGNVMEYDVYPIYHQFGVGNYTDYNDMVTIDETSTDRFTDLQTFMSSVM